MPTNTAQTISVLRKNITHTMDVTLPCQDNNYQLNSNIYFNNSDLFSLLSRNMDILPEDFQEILMCKDSKNNEKEASRLEPAQANEILRKEGESIESNPYLSSLGSSYSLHGIWRKHLAK